MSARRWLPSRFLLLAVTAASLCSGPLWAAAPGFEAFAQEPAMSDARLSPNGQHLAALQRFTRDGKQLLLIYDAADLGAKPVTLGSSKMDIDRFRWVNNDYLVVRFRQDIDTLQKLGVATRFAFKLASIDRNGKRWREIPRNRTDRRSEISKTIHDLVGSDIFDLLPKDDEHILIRQIDDSNGVRDIYKVNVITGWGQRVARNSNKIFLTHIDEQGQPRLALSFDAGDEAIVYLGRLKGQKEWLEMGRLVANMDANSQIFRTLMLLDSPSGNEFLVLSNHESDTAGVYVYDLEKQAFGELQFRHPNYDATGLRTVLDGDRNRQIVGFEYTGKSRDVYLVDAQEEARYQAINRVLPGVDNRIVSRSDDFSSMVIRAEGPQMPPSWYLLKGEKLNLLGRSLPELGEDSLAPVEWVHYRARDGMEIPALVTMPRGDAPFPLVVMPHGGPVARDYWGFDVWSQLLAYHGYLVVQPQFRISAGFGRRHLEAGFARWGHQMQDDLEDAITYLAERKLADPGRAAIFGWSYGGYAALVGSFRDPNPFRCAIAGAAVAELPYFRAWLADSNVFAEKAYRKTVAGLNPLDHAGSVDVPLLLIHGDKDERVPVQESRKFVEKLEQFNRANKPGKLYKYLELEGANHFFGTIYYRHYMKMYPAIIDWLDHTCRLAERGAPVAGLEQNSGE